MVHLKPVRVLITGAGAPGIYGTLYSLKNNFDNRKIKTVGIDIKDEVLGKYICDDFYIVPKPNEDNYIDYILNICELENIDVLLPQTTAELYKLSINKGIFSKIGTKIAISNYDSLRICNNKLELLKIFKKLQIPHPQFFVTNNYEDLIEKAEKIDFPEKKVVVKPLVSSGMRGFRILDENMDMKKEFFNKKPSGTTITSQRLYEILGDEFPDLILMEYLPGEEYSVDCFRTNIQEVVIPRIRTHIRTGITFDGITEKNEEIIEYSKRVSKELNLEFIFGFQYKMDSNGHAKIIECNPRIQGTMILAHLSGANIIYASVKHALGEETPKFDIKWGTRIIRCWGGIAIYKNKVKNIEL